MNLSKTAKRFLSSTMAIALAGGSVLAFGNSAFGSAEQTSDVGFTGTVAPECALDVDGTAPDANKAYITDDFNTGLTTSGDNRAKNLTAFQTIKYDCNSAAVKITVSDAKSSYTAPSSTEGDPASKLTAKHTWEWGKGDAATNAFSPDSGNATLGLLAGEATDPDGDIKVSIKSTWAADNDELLATTYNASLTLTVTAQ